MIIITIISITVIYVLSSVVFFHSNICKVDSSTLETVAFISYFSLIVFFVIYSSIKYFFMITIDEISEQIFFKNIITFKKSTYSFTDFDGYVDTFAKTNWGNFKVIYFIKNNKIEKIIRGNYYSNMDEMQGALGTMNYLGFKENFKLYYRKSLLNQEIK